MARIKIEDLPKDMKISKEEMKKVLGGTTLIASGQLSMGSFKPISFQTSEIKRTSPFASGSECDDCHVQT